jgi:NDP-sugar pyrophosphorylase family protein
MSMFPVVILAGGIATRLRPVTEQIPKALVEVGGEPFIAHQLRLLHTHGIRQVFISAWYKGEMIKSYLGDGSAFGLHVDYVFDGDSPLGTGGAVRKAAPMLHGPFFVLYGDSYLPCEYGRIQEYFSLAYMPGLMTVYRNQGRWDTSNVEMAGGEIVRYDKKERTPMMEFIDYGLGIFHPAAFSFLEEGKAADLVEVYQTLISQGGLLACEVSQRFYEIGSFEGLNELDALLTNDPLQFLNKESL